MYKLLSLTMVLSLTLIATAKEPATKGTKVRVAAISFVPKKFDLKSNVKRLTAAFRKAAKGGAKIAVAPEGILEGYVVNEIISGKATEQQMNKVAISITGDVIDDFCKLAKELKMCLAFGFAERIGGEVFNSAVFIDFNGKISGKYHKMQLAEGYHPSWWYNRLGAKSRAFDTPYGRAGFMICNDRWNPLLAKIPALDGAQFLIIPSFGSRSLQQDKAVLSRGTENNIPVIEANVGVTLLVSSNKIVAVDRKEEHITFGTITIPKAKKPNVKERDKVELKFLKQRAVNMPARYLRTLKRLANSKKK